MNLYERIAHTHLRQWGLPCENVSLMVEQGKISFEGKICSKTVIRCAQLAAFKSKSNEREFVQYINRLHKQGAVWFIENTGAKEGLKISLNGVGRNESSIIVRTANEIQQIAHQCQETIGLVISGVFEAYKKYQNVSLLKLKRSLNYEIRVISELDDYSDVSDWDEDVFFALIESITAKQRGIFSLKVQVVQKATNIVLSEVAQSGCILDVNGVSQQCNIGFERKLVRDAILLARKRISSDLALHG
ncbi:TPA: hypothetical protein GRR76_20530 [Vibrio parahaemolyticus]|nr:hypothetical protein [Vibrio parahaemolyticus]EHU5133998.1 hypothetical protein [Vibrio parahaemolyticus]HAS6469864.1 hypothetical protein [Vibrio parahaemolyticus]